LDHPVSINNNIIAPLVFGFLFGFYKIEQISNLKKRVTIIMMMAKPKILFQYGTLLLTLIFTLGILQFPSLQQQQYYQSATAQQQQQENNETTSSSISNDTNMTTGTELIPENARGPAIPQDKGYLV
jgi:hypothetical protein